MVDCNFYLLCLPPELSAPDFASKLRAGGSLIAGFPHGWVLQPHAKESQGLLSHAWNAFLLTKASTIAIDALTRDSSIPHVKGTVSIPQPQYEQLLADMNKPATPAGETPPLPQEWKNGRTGHIPERHILPAKGRPLQPGELKLYQPMAAHLSAALPNAVRDQPVSLFNLFKYRNGNPAVHEHYMQGFKEKFGPAAGAQMKFMGPVMAQPKYIHHATGGDSGDGGAGDEGGEMGWQDANIVQYDSIWHYAYMLSTDVYRELNEEKVRGLEDTCILLVSEIELQGLQ